VLLLHMIMAFLPALLSSLQLGSLTDTGIVTTDLLAAPAFVHGHVCAVTTVLATAQP
jgi:hypothetical protein